MHATVHPRVWAVQTHSPGNPSLSVFEPIPEGSCHSCNCALCDESCQCQCCGSCEDYYEALEAWQLANS